MSNKLTVTYQNTPVINGQEIEGDAAISYKGITICTVSAGEEVKLNTRDKYTSDFITIAGEKLNTAGKIIKDFINVKVEAITPPPIIDWVEFNNPQELIYYYHEPFYRSSYDVTIHMKDGSTCSYDGYNLFLLDGTPIVPGQVYEPQNFYIQFYVGTSSYKSLVPTMVTPVVRIISEGSTSTHYQDYTSYIKINGESPEEGNIVYETGEYPIITNSKEYLTNPYITFYVKSGKYTNGTVGSGYSYVRVYDPSTGDLTPQLKSLTEFTPVYTIDLHSWLLGDACYIDIILVNGTITQAQLKPVDYVIRYTNKRD